MNLVQKLANHWKSDTGKRLFLALLVALGVSLFLVLARSAAEHERAGKTPAAILFEKEADTWLEHPSEVSDFMRAMEAGQVQAVAVAKSVPLALYTDRKGGRFSATLVPCGSRCSTDLSGRLSEMSVKYGFTLAVVDVDPRSPSQVALEAITGFLGFLVALIPMLVIFGFLMHKMGAGEGKTADLAERPDARFPDVVGAESAKKALRRVVAFMKDPAAYTEVGSRVPRGVLLVGPPGTGKTLIARALAGEANASFVSIDGSYFSSKFYGAGITRVKTLFAKLRKLAKKGPVILFIDEADGLGSRTEGGNGGEMESNRIVNALLVEMDGFDVSDNIVIVGATNHVDNLDPAMLRPGRFDLKVKIDLPTAPERIAIFEMYSKKVKAETLDLVTLSKMSAGMSPADVANATNVAAAYAAEAGEKTVSMARFVQAIETKQMGGEVTSTDAIITGPTRSRLGVHEGGHALVAYLLDTGSVDHISVESRETSLGATYITRHSEEPLYGERELRTRLSMMLGGREAEFLVYGNTSTGAGDDLKRASELAFSMVAQMGFGQTIGDLSLAGIPKEFIPSTVQHEVLDEAKKILAEARLECRAALEAHKDGLHLLADLLVLRGTIGGDELQTVLAGIKERAARGEAQRSLLEDEDAVTA